MGIKREVEVFQKSDPGDLENYSVAEGRVVFTCDCGSKHFTLHRRTMTEVDFSQEGAVEGHPFIRNAGEKFEYFLCFECGAEVPDGQAQEMLKEVFDGGQDWIDSAR